MTRAFIDHLVIAAPSLAAGADYVRDTLGVEMAPGGEHPRLGTHHRLLKLGETTYLEVLAVNPNAPRPNHPHWFGLDSLASDAIPRLVAWVARVDDIRGVVAASSFDFGDVREMSRDDLTWLITVGRGGQLPLDGVAPVLIQWLTGKHPTSRLPDARCTLATLRGAYPDETAALTGLDVDPRWLFSSVRGPGLEASIQTPAGLRTLRTSLRA